MPWNSELVMPPSPSESDPTPLRAQYLKKSQIQLQFAREFALIASQGSSVNVSTLSYLGPPFSPPPRDTPPVHSYVTYFVDFPVHGCCSEGFLFPKVAAVRCGHRFSKSVVDFSLQ
jgi:hypothetical protein